jgi:hypothetical protein
VVGDDEIHISEDDATFGVPPDTGPNREQPLDFGSPTQVAVSAQEVAFGTDFATQYHLNTTTHRLEYHFR